MRGLRRAEALRIRLLYLCVAFWGQCLQASPDKFLGFIHGTATPGAPVCVARVRHREEIT